MNETDEAPQIRGHEVEDLLDRSYAPDFDVLEPSATVDQVAEYLTGSLLRDIGEALHSIEPASDQAHSSPERAKGFEYLSEYVAGVHEGVNGALAVLGDYTPALTKPGAEMADQRPGHKGHIVETIEETTMENDSKNVLVEHLSQMLALLDLSGRMVIEKTETGDEAGKKKYARHIDEAEDYLGQIEQAVDALFPTLSRSA